MTQSDGTTNGGIDRRTFLAAAAAAASVPAIKRAAAPLPVRGPAGKKRNIVIIITDDQRHDALGFRGHPFVETPNLDRLAKNGCWARNAFVTTALCSPSRATMLTGQYAHRHGVLDNETILPAVTPIYPRLLQENGWRTAYVGKWHMGGSTDAPRPGWHRWASFKGQGVYENPLFNIDGRPVGFKGYVTDIITDIATDIIEEEKKGPFCLVVGHKAVHNPFTPAPRHRDLYADKKAPAPMRDEDLNYAGSPRWVRAQRRSWHGLDGTNGKGLWDGNYPSFDAFYRDYMRTIVAIDESVGRIVQALEKAGKLDSTFLLFTSDNGFLMGEHGLLDKRCMYDESIRVPLIAHCPELIPAGGVRDELIANVDHAPTYLEIAGIPVPAEMQGESFLPLLTAQGKPWRDAFLYEYFFEREYPQTPTVLGVRSADWKYMEFHGIWEEKSDRALYDLKKDPGEMTNLIDDPKLAEVRRKLESRLIMLVTELGARRKPSWKA